MEGKKQELRWQKQLSAKQIFYCWMNRPITWICTVVIYWWSLNKYQGSYILVSHDRYFISKTANKIWEILDHEIKEFKGGYEEYVQWKERMAKSETDNKKSEKSVAQLKENINPTAEILSTKQCIKTLRREMTKPGR